MSTKSSTNRSTNSFVSRGHFLEPRVGDILKGRVIGLLDWGVLVALPGDCVGRLPNGQISWSREKVKAREIFASGADITVIVRKINRSKTHSKLFIVVGYRQSCSRILGTW